MKAHAIRTARVPARLSQRRVTRPALEHWLAEADPARHGLPSQAIVLVRRLQAPWAELADPEAGTRYGALASALAGAARPARGELHGNVVWFADEAELLACLARAVLAGTLALHWWWKLVLRELAPAAARARWLASVQAAPRALTRLEESTARRWIATWPAPEQRLLVNGLARVFPLAEEAVLEELARAESVTSAKTQAGLGAAQPDVVIAVVAIPLGDGLRRLLLALAREPTAAKDAQHVRAIWQELATETATRSTSLTAQAEPVLAAEALPPARDASTAATPTARPAIAHEGARANSPALRVAEDPAWHVNASHSAPPAVAGNEVEAPRTSAREIAEIMPPTESAPTAFLSTEFGGILFLLNAALQLGLYGDFTQPRRPRTLDCSPWRFLLASGRLYAGRAFADDPLAAWLRERAPQRPAGLRTRHPGLWRALRERLAAALALDDPTQLAPALLRLPARIEDGGERVDLHMELATLPLPVRLAGLDRDPGWIPAAGCDVRFHFH